MKAEAADGVMLAIKVHSVSLCTLFYVVSDSSSLKCWQISKLYAVIHGKGSKAKVTVRQLADRLQPSPGPLVSHFYNRN